MKAEEAMSRSWQINGRRGVSRRVASPLRARLIFLDTRYMDAALISRAARGPIDLAPRRPGNRTCRCANGPRIRAERSSSTDDYDLRPNLAR